MQCLRPRTTPREVAGSLGGSRKRPEMKVHAAPPLPGKVSKGCPTKVTGAGTEAARAHAITVRGAFIRKSPASTPRTLRCGSTHFLRKEGHSMSSEELGWWAGDCSARGQHSQRQDSPSHRRCTTHSCATHTSTINTELLLGLKQKEPKGIKRTKPFSPSDQGRPNHQLPQSQNTF